MSEDAAAALGPHGDYAGVGCPHGKRGQENLVCIPVPVSQELRRQHSPPFMAEGHPTLR